ncbi:MAG: tRNA pseudouridine(54/55) synthase Pus10 [Candidatus Bathyarchaeota archaeon]|nr:tRNA pseudouridine(54/55) synthase Pus10 [Candidatus Bathyarchaeota archaeon]
MELLDKAQHLLNAQALCDHCLGRQFALLGYGLGDEERGQTLKLLLTMKNHQLAITGKKEGFSNLRILASRGSFEMAAQILKNMRKRAKKTEPCYLCQGLFESTDIMIDNAMAALKDYEYNTFLVGIELPNLIEEREDEFKAHHEISYGESMRNEFSRHIGKKLSDATQKLADFKKPDVVVLVRPFTGEVIVQSNPLYVRGSYKKLVRDIPQSKWFCRQCHGEGCKNCNGTGKMYSESVEEIIAAPLLKKTEGEEVALHAAGREDVDARMLGNGRPFILEIKRPKNRFMDLNEIEQDINEQAKGKVEVLNLKSATKVDIKRLKKGEGSTKVYKVFIDFDRDVSEEEMASVAEKLSKIVVHQRTPLRVLHRRADLVREKYIYEAYLKRLAPNRAEMKIRCQGGLYIKELVSGDEGRTIPSVASIINAQAKPVDLDVLNVIMED